MKLTVVLVHYQTPELLEASVRCIHERSLEEAPGTDVVVVDNGSELVDRQAIDGLPAKILRPEKNLGYAGGINLGVSSAPSDAYLVMNPDVVLLPGCLRELMRVLSEGTDIAGPSCSWDDGLRFLMPPSDPRTRWAEMISALASRSKKLEGFARSFWRHHARRHWLAQEPLTSESLSGAVLAFSDRAWHRIGPFDDKYQLYFEETDWLRRAQQLGMLLHYVPAARAIHRYARSTRDEPKAEQWFAESAARFRERHYGRLFSSLLEKVSRSVEFVDGSPTVTGDVPLDPACSWVEVSPNPVGFPAVGERIGESGKGVWSFPGELVEGWADRRLWVTQCDRRGREVSRVLYLA